MQNNLKIILEGSESVGKTTFAKFLQTQSADFQYFHFSSADFKNCSSIKKFTTIKSYLENFNGPIIIDRLYLSTYIYDKVFNRSNKISWWQIKKLHKIAIKNGWIVLHLFSDNTKYLKKNEPEFIKNNILKLNKMFKKFASKLKLTNINLFRSIDNAKKDNY